MSLESQYQKFAIEDCLGFIEGKGGLPFIEIENEYASALISIYGAQVLSYKPKLDGKNKSLDSDLLFVSEEAYFEQGKEIKGGIPICWPWFGRDPEGLGRQIHGFARNMLWQLDDTSVSNTGETQVVFSLSESEETLKLWPHAFKLTLTIKVGRTLNLSLKTVNTGKTPFKITQALHTYFSIGDISQTQIEGLDKVYYLDKVVGAEKFELQTDRVTVNQEVDRIYVDAPSQLTLSDIKSNRQVAIKSKGSKTVVVWNPWIDISKQSGDLADDAYLGFICVETANAVEDYVVVEPNESFTIEAGYTVS